jgi:hypothetical protein
MRNDQIVEVGIINFRFWMTTGGARDKWLVVSKLKFLQIVSTTCSHPGPIVYKAVSN